MRSRTYSPLEYAAQWARKLKKVQAKKLVKSNYFFEQNKFFAISKMAKNKAL